MGTIEDKLTRVKTTKSEIASALNAKGVTVSDSDTFASYASKINSMAIPTKTSELENDSNFQTASQVAAIIQTNTTNKADLVDGLVPSNQLPSYVDDVIEANSKTSFPETGEQGKIYVDTSTNIIYRWSGSTYIEITNPIDYASTEEATAGTNDTKVMTPLKTKSAIDNSLTTVNAAIQKNAQDIEKVQLGAITSVSWEDIKSKPETFTPSTHSHTVSNITDMPNALKNPNALTVKVNGVVKTSYDGSSAKEVNVTLDSLGGAESDHTHSAESINSLSGYTKATVTNSIQETDTLLVAVGKLEKYIEDVESQIGDISSLLDSINGEVI